MPRRYGVLAADPELIYSPNGLAICRMSVRGESGKYVRLVAFGDLAEEMTQELGKGDDVSVTGYFKERVFEDVRGERQSAEEFIVKSWRLR